jgi:signal peptidase II
MAAYAVDVVTKVLAVEKLSAGGDVELVGSWLVLHLTRNPGAAFSTGTEFTLVLSAIAIAAVVVVVFLGRRVGSTAWAWAFGLLLGGVCGNLTDRILREPGPMRGHVVDFLMVPNWPVFNIADICINVAAGLILLQAIRGVGIDGSRAAAREREA